MSTNCQVTVYCFILQFYGLIQSNHRKFDYENYLASLFIPSNEIRRTAFALRAFNVDLSQIRDLTKTDNLAQIRFQFWSDIIDDIYKNKNHFDESSDKTYKNFPVAAELQIVKI